MRFKQPNIYLILSFLLFSCIRDKKTAEEKKYELEVIKQINEQVIFALNALLSDLNQNVRNSGNRFMDVRILESSEGVSSFKEPYLKQRNIPNLLAYTESILKIDGKSYRKIRYEKINRFVLSEIKRLKNEIAKTDDSLTQAQLFYWTLKAESDFLKENATKINFLLKRHGHVVSLINSEKFTLGDSVYIVVTNFNNCLEYYILKPISSVVLNKNTKEKFKLKPIQLAMQCIFHAVPQKRGKYEFQGKFLINKSETGNTENDTVTVTQYFEVL